jgi:hypothetical protein
MEFHMEFHKVWQEQCEATRTIRERFGVKSALDYLVGEKLLNFASGAERSLEFVAELPRFRAAVWDKSSRCVDARIGFRPSLSTTVSFVPESN